MLRPVSRRAVPLAARLAAKLVRDEATGCLLFTAPDVDRRGYGQIRAGGRGTRKLRAHRVAYALARALEPEELPPEVLVRHRCDTPACCDPEHLLAGDNQANTDDAVARGRRRVGARHHAAKLTDDQVAQLVATYRAGGTTMRAVAADYGISSAHVSDLVHGHYRQTLTR